jgi:hypothetical protein
LAVIARLSWRVAQPQPWGCTVFACARPENEGDFVALFEAIQASPVFERWAGADVALPLPRRRSKRTMTAHLPPSTRIINRMLVADDIERLRAESQVE